MGRARHKFESVFKDLRTNNTMMKVQGVAMRFLLVAVVAVSSITTYVCADASNPLDVRSVSGNPVAQIQKEFQELNEQVTYACDVQLANATDWLQQCAYYFKLGGFKHEEHMTPKYSSYYLKDQECGLCTMTMSSAFKNMMYGRDVFTVLNETDLATAQYDEINADLPPLKLPSIVSFPHTAKDVVELVKFANKHELPVSVKNSGHSYSGQSSVGNSLLLNMRSYPEYSKKNLFECKDVSEDSHAAGACKLATARGKGAVVRVGGGEGNDNLYRNVGSWNYKLPRDQKYDPFAGAEGMIGAGGGWLLGGGLGMGQERSWGVGVDQVLELEMVLPDGRHVRFGPTEWAEKEGFLYPQTTKVEGLCNANVNHHESLWQWESCEDEPVWEDLWFAVRGGGGGTFGVLLSTYYQLHDLEPYYTIKKNSTAFDALTAICDETEDDCASLEESANSMWADFLIDYLWNPSALGIEANVSLKCGYSNAAFAFTERTNWITCRGDPHDTFVKAWKEYVPTSPYLPSANLTDLLSNAITSCKVYGGSFGRHRVLATVAATPYCEGEDRVVSPSELEGAVNQWHYTTPMGHLMDYGGLNAFWPYAWSAMIPVAAFQNEKDYWVDFFAKAGLKAVNHHCLGGNVAISSDGMTPQPRGYREAAIQIVLSLPDTNITGYEDNISWVQEHVLKYLQTDGKDFPGFSELNHQFGWYAGPLKEDWNKACPLEIEEDERRERCMSVQETLFGTRNWKRLEDIKSRFDPLNLFSVRLGIGNTDVIPSVPTSFPSLTF